MIQKTRMMTLGALFMALGVLVPVLFHFVGLGPMFLPMFWPLAVGGFFLPISFAVLVGIITPLISTLTTGMPPPPILYKMMLELGCLMGGVRCLFVFTRWGTLWIVLGGLGFAIAAGLLGAALLAPVLGLPPKLYAIASLIEGIPGIAAILVFVPSIVARITGMPVFRMRKDHVQGA